MPRNMCALCFLSLSLMVSYDRLQADVVSRSFRVLLGVTSRAHSIIASHITVRSTNKKIRNPSSNK
jgi:hypothetical protein